MTSILSKLKSRKQIPVKFVKEPFSPFVDRETFSWKSFAKRHFWLSLFFASAVLNISLYLVSKESFEMNTKFHELFAIQANKTKITEEENRRLVSLVESDSSTDIVEIGKIIHEIMDTADNDTQTKFLTSILPHAIRFQIQKNVPVSGMIAQAIYESGYGKSELARQNYNYFGLKAPTDGSVPYTMMSTTDSGVTHLQPFRKFSGPYDGFCGYYSFLSSSDKNGRYDAAFQQTSGIEFVHCLLKAGYCPNSDYLESIRSIIQRHHLDKLEKIIIKKKDTTTPTVAPATVTTAATSPKYVVAVITE